MNDRRILLLLAAAIFASGVAMFSASRTWWHKKPSLKLGPYEEIGIRAAEETAKLLGQKGRVVVIAGELDSPVIGAEVKAFQKALRKQPGLSIVAVETVAIDPLRPPEFVALFQKHAGVDAVVSFYGFPEFSPSQLAQLPTPLPKVVAILNGILGAKQLFASGADGLYIVATVPPKPRKPGDPFTLEIVRARPSQ